MTEPGNLAPEPPHLNLQLGQPGIGLAGPAPLLVRLQPVTFRLNPALAELRLQPLDDPRGGVVAQAGLT